MKKFVFYDSDSTGNEEFDISGEEYYELLSSCFNHSSTFAIVLSPFFTGNIEEWEKYRIPVTHNVKEVYSHYGDSDEDSPERVGAYEIRHYRLSPHLCDLIKKQTDSIFKWICGWGFDNPDDPTFFREDGSIFFSSVIHEGECMLFLNDDESLYGNKTDSNWSLVM